MLLISSRLCHQATKIFVIEGQTPPTPTPPTMTPTPPTQLTPLTQRLPRDVAAFRIFFLSLLTGSRLHLESDRARMSPCWAWAHFVLLHTGLNRSL